MHVFARTVADALFDVPWRLEAILGRLRETFGEDRPWMHSLAERLTEELAVAPDDRDELADLLASLGALHHGMRERPLLRRWATDAPEMAESPWPVPTVATTKELAVWLGVEVDALIALADARGISRVAAEDRRRHYRYTWVQKRAGHRLLEAPKSRLRTIQRYVLDDIVARIPPHPAAHGFRRGHSISTFAAPHVGRAVVIRLDLSAFFTSVFRARVASILRTAGYPDGVARTLAALCTHATPRDVLAAAPASTRHDPLALARFRSPHLPQGAPTSGALANLAAYRLDVRVAALASALGARYTRYADDLALSGDRELVRAAPTIIARIGAIASEEGFALNFRKTRVMTAATRQRLTGLVVNAKLAVARGELDELRAILHNCARTGPEAQNRDTHLDLRGHLLGRISWVASVDAAKGARLRSLFERIRWTDDAAGPR